MRNRIAAGLGALVLSCQPFHKEIVLSPVGDETQNDAEVVAEYVKRHGIRWEIEEEVYSFAEPGRTGFRVIYSPTDIHHVRDLNTTKIATVDVRGSLEVSPQKNCGCYFVDFEIDGDVDQIQTLRGNPHSLNNERNLTLQEANERYNLLLKNIREELKI